MNLKELKEWINSIPEDFSDYAVEVVKAEGQLDEEFSYRVDASIIGLSVNQNDQHVLIFIEEDSNPEKEN